MTKRDFDSHSRLRRQFVDDRLHLQTYAIYGCETRKVLRLASLPVVQAPRSERNKLFASRGMDSHTGIEVGLGCS